MIFKGSRKIWNSTNERHDSVNRRVVCLSGLGGCEGGGVGGVKGGGAMQ